MHSKLTLRLDSSIIEIAKEIAKREGKSVSQLVADYFKGIKAKISQEKTEYSPITKKIKGVLKNQKILEKDYQDHLERKYL